MFNREQLIAGAVLGEEVFLTTLQLDIKNGIYIDILHNKNYQIIKIQCITKGAIHKLDM